MTWGALAIGFMLGVAAGWILRGPAGPPRASARPSDPLPRELHDEVTRLLRENQKIAAIKTLRDATGVGLREAKDRVEELDRARPR